MKDLGLHKEKIFPHLILIKVPYLTFLEESAFINIFLIVDEELVLIDTGPWRKDFTETLSPCLAQLGFSIADISRIIYTHAHPDHMAGGIHFKREGECSHSIYWKAREYVEKYGQYTKKLKILCKETFFEHLYLHPEEGKHYFNIVDSFWHPTFGEIKIDHELRDGDIINTGRYKFEVVFTPGHSPWDISLWEPNQAILFTGDFLMEKSTTLIGDMQGFGSNLVSYESSLKKIDQYVKRAGYIFPSHGIPITNNSQLPGDLLGIIKWREERIIKELSSRKCRLVDLAGLFSSHRDPVVIARQLGVVLTHIEKLEDEKRILRTKRDNGEILFSLKE